ncbi:hypothetical protein DL96DRAFT_143934 [Flagelloscypha sp. PMI_526]|nr:hypothetical protein DL96DRAFT_143934 [Flagelloscypha sp. PMI_526]
MGGVKHLQALHQTITMRFILLAALFSFAVAVPMPNAAAHPDSIVARSETIQDWVKRNPVPIAEANPGSIVDRYSPSAEA